MTFETFEAEYRNAIEAVESELGVRLDRWRSSKLTCGRGGKPPLPPLSEHHHQFPHYHWLPGLTAQPFWTLSDMPAYHQARLRPFQEAFQDIRDAFERESRGETFRPTGHTHVGRVTAWKQLPLRDLSEAWLPFSKRFSHLMSLLEPLAKESLIQGSLYFAALDGHLPPHCGGNNGRLVMHLPLRIPKSHCGIRCGGKIRTWDEGQWLAIDDTYPHEAWNHSGDPRYILLMTVAHPDFSDVERRASRMMKNRMSPLYRDFFSVGAITSPAKTQ